MSRTAIVSRLAKMAIGAIVTASCLTCYRDPSGPTDQLRSPDGTGPSLATLPSGISETMITGGLASPTAMAIAPDGRVFIAEQGGRLRVVKNNVLLSTPFLTLSVNVSGERGLLGVAFDPAFASNQYIYVYYTVPSPLHNRVSRFTANGDVAVAGSEMVLLDLDGLSAANNHNGGATHFGPDGKLYIAAGDNANSANSQSMSTLLGKIMRINSDGSIPTDNPFYGTASGKYRAIWAMGLRNPFTFAFQPGTGRLFINDVGENTTEEINQGVAGANYGWPTCEGPCSPTRSQYTDPISWYSHSGGACAITGGTFYNPSGAQLLPSSYVGKYFFGDYCGNWMRTLDPSTNSTASFASNASAPVDLAVGIDGGLYYLLNGTGALWRIASTASQAPQVSQQPADASVSAGQSASFTVSATGSPTLTYQWQRNGSAISGASSATYTIASTTLADNGATFRCVVTNGFGSATSNSATLTVANNDPPSATILTPDAGTTYQGGMTINFSGSGTDPETGDVAASGFTWEIVFHHDTHTHPFMQPTTGSKSGSVVIPTVGEVSANVWYRIRLTVKDPGGATTTVERDITPQTATIGLAANPTGAQLTLDGQPVTAPYSVLGVVGIQRTLGVVTPQTIGGTSYSFTSWSDGGAASHTIATPASNTTYTAAFDAVPCNYALASQSRSTGSAGGSYSVGVTAGAGCNWNAASNDAWISITAGQNGTSNGTVSYTVAANSGPQRSGTMTIAGLTFTVNQSSGCAYSITPTSRTVSSTGTTGSVTVTAGSGCAWTSVSNDGFLTVTSGASGSGDGTTAYSVAANSGPQRNGSITIAGQPFTVTQNSGCAYSISPTSQTYSASANSGSVAVSTAANCPWTAASNDGFITVTSGASGSGGGTVNYSLTANSGAQRTGSITIGGQPFSVTQSGGCAYSITPTSRTVSSTGTTGSVTITAGSGCAWTSVSNDGFLTVTSGASGSGSGTTAYSVAANSGPQRNGSITIAGQPFTVTQNSGCAYSISPTSQTYSASANSGSVAVSTAANCPWTAASNDGFITVTSGASGSGGGTVNYSLTANSGAQRTGSITIGGQPFSVTQSGSCAYSITPTSRTVSSTATTGSVTITAGSGCAWTSTSNAGWITVTSGASGTGGGSTNYSVSANSGPQRNGSITIAGQAFSITQSSGCAYTISPTSRSVGATSTTGTVSITTGASCPWTSTSNAGWITVTSGASGTSSGSMGYSVAANSGGSRSGTVTIAGQTFTVNQSAGASCSYAANPTVSYANMYGGLDTLTVTAPSGCSWTATSSAGWVSITAGASGSGNGSVIINVGANSGSFRYGMLTVAGQSMMVMQGAACGTVSPTSRTFTAAAATASLSVTAASSCSWTVTTDRDWIVISGQPGGTGNGTVNYSIQANGGGQRTGTITAGTTRITITQAGAP